MKIKTSLFILNNIPENRVLENDSQSIIKQTEFIVKKQKL